MQSKASVSPDGRSGVALRRWAAVVAPFFPGAAAVALIVGVVEAVGLARAGLSVVEFSTTAAATAAVVAVFALAVAVSVAAVVRRVEVRALTTVGLATRVAFRWAGGVPLIVVGGYAARALADYYFVGAGMRAVAAAWLLLPTAVVALFAAQWLGGIAERRGLRSVSWQVVLTAAGLMTLTTCGLLFAFEQEVWIGLGGWDWLGVILAPIAALAGARWRVLGHSWVRWTSIAAGAVLSAGTVARAIVPLQPKTESAIESASMVTRRIFALAESARSAFTRRAPIGSEHYGTCFPDQSVASLGSVGSADDDAPDILLVTFDGVRWDHTSLAGYKRDTTPEMKHYAPSGFLFEGAYSNSASTRQTFRSLLSGLYPSQVEPSEGRSKWLFTFAPGQRTLASYLSAAGYQTVTIQTNGVFTNEGMPGLQGFDVKDDSPSPAMQTRKFTADLHVDRVISYLSNPRPRKPLFIFTHMMEPHHPFRPGPKPKVFGNIKNRRDRYDSAVHFVDRQVARLIRYVLSPEREENTILILTADHGMGLGDRGMSQHGNSLYEDQTHVPLLFFGKGVKPGKVALPISLIDLFPTVVDAAGLDSVSHICGRSLWPVVTGESEFEKRPVVVQIWPDKANSHDRISYVEDGVKLIVDRRKRWRQLYDLKNDPRERTDLSESQPQLLADYEARLGRWLSEHGSSLERKKRKKTKK